MSELRLPRLISNGMVLQQKSRVHLCGYDKPGRNIFLSFLETEQRARTRENGVWEIWLEDLKAGGPYTMKIRDCEGNKLDISDIWIGDVWMCAGQSNMELTMERVMDDCPGAITDCRNPAIRMFKITAHAEYHEPLCELLTGEWEEARPDTVLRFSAAAWFFAFEMYQRTEIPVGLINASLGGSRIESWMGRDMLEGYQEFLDLAERYDDVEFIEHRIAQNECNSKEWNDHLDSIDQGVREHWEYGCGNSCEEIEIPFFFRDSKLINLSGSVWFQRRFNSSDSMAGKRVKLWLGTGCRYITLVYLLYIIILLCYTIENDKGARPLMDNLNTSSAITIGELTRLVKEFEDKIKAGTEDPDRFLTLAEIERLWGTLIGDTNALYSDMLQRMISGIDEKDLIRKKKTSTEQRESD